MASHPSYGNAAVCEQIQFYSIVIIITRASGYHYRSSRSTPGLYFKVTSVIAQCFTLPIPICLNNRNSGIFNAFSSFI